MKPQPEVAIKKKKSWQPVDITAPIAILICSAVAGLLSIASTFIGPRVAEFSWQEKRVSDRDRAFTLEFNHPMDRDSVATNLKITPELPGKISWQGTRKLFYTPTEPAQYGETYQIQLQGAVEQRGELGRPNRRLPPFQTSFVTRDRAFAYLGVEGEEKGRLVLYNFTREEKEILTPRDLIVIDFEPYPDRDRILFSALDPSQETDELQLYAVTTGLSSDRQPPGQLHRLLAPDDYKTLQFDLSSDGQILVIERVSRLNPNEISLWVLPQNGTLRSLGIQGIDFTITPDSQTVAVSQERGISLIPLTPQAESLDLLRGYQRILDFFPNSNVPLLLTAISPQSGARSLVWQTPQDKRPQQLETPADLRDCEFDPQQKWLLYCFQIGGEQQPSDQPVLSLVNLKDQTSTPFLALANYPEVVLSMSPDGFGLLFDQVVSQNVNSTNPEPTQGDFIASLWLLPPPKIRPGQPLKISPPEKLFPGLNPVWLP